MSELASDSSTQAANDAAEFTSCCAATYSSDLVALLLGDSYHPGGLALTRRLADRLALAPGEQVLDVAAGRGTSALMLAREFAVTVDGVDLSAANMALATGAARAAGVADAAFFVGDGAALPFPDGLFDAVVCECALCTFTDKPAAAAEFARVLRPGGTLFFAGEPSRQGDRIAAWPKRAAMRVAPLWRRAVRARPVVWGDDNGAPPSSEEAEHALESVVDVHAFDPGDLERLMAGAGFVSGRVRGEELLANWFGWFNRTL
jgi:SAM-dependent methyltransferase